MSAQKRGFFAGFRTPSVVVPSTKISHKDIDNLDIGKNIKEVKTGEFSNTTDATNISLGNVEVPTSSTNQTGTSKKTKKRTGILKKHSLSRKASKHVKFTKDTKGNSSGSESKLRKGTKVIQKKSIVVRPRSSSVVVGIKSRMKKLKSVSNLTSRASSKRKVKPKKNRAIISNIVTQKNTSDNNTNEKMRSPFEKLVPSVEMPIERVLTRKPIQNAIVNALRTNIENEAGDTGSVVINTLLPKLKEVAERPHTKVDLSFFDQLHKYKIKSSADRDQKNKKKRDDTGNSGQDKGSDKSTNSAYNSRSNATSTSRGNGTSNDGDDPNKKKKQPPTTSKPDDKSDDESKQSNSRSSGKKRKLIEENSAKISNDNVAAAVPANSAQSAEDENDKEEEDKDSKKKKNRCAECRKKVGLTGFQCRCGGLFCAVHRYSDKHNCTFNYREHGAQEIRRNNPVVVGEKIQKI